MVNEKPVFNFFIAGGTLPPEAPSYVRRPADRELYEAVRDGKFSYVLTPRQMGKSSLMVRTARRLTAEGVQTAIIDLNQIGTRITVEQWYLGLLTKLTNQLKLVVDIENWWQSRSNLGPVQRFNEFLHDVLLTEIKSPIAIFIDEIDSTLSLSFTDDFFAVIRAIYNSRATDSSYERLTFVLLGVATPADLIVDRNRTPFNIGQRIDLREFSRADAEVLQKELQTHLLDQGQAVFERIFHWTNGQPYFTQKLCLAVTESQHRNWTDNEIDALVHRLYLSDEAKRETNLQFIRENVKVNSYKRDLLRLYQQVYQGKRVTEDERSLVQNYLKLYGLLQGNDGVLTIRNEIYRHAFNETWIRTNLPADWARRIVFISIFIAILLIGSLGYYSWRQDRKETEALAEQAIATFEGNTNPSLRLNSLNELFSLDDYRSEARDLFFELSEPEQLALFSSETSELPMQRFNVIKGIYTVMDNSPTNNRRLVIMQTALSNSGDADSQLLADEISYWLAGREAYLQEDYSEAISNLESAVGLNNENPVLYFDMASSFVAQGQHTLALENLDAALSLSLDEDVTLYWQDRIEEVVMGNEELYAAWRSRRANYEALSVILPTPTKAE